MKDICKLEESIGKKCRKSIKLCETKNVYWVCLYWINRHKWRKSIECSKLEKPKISKILYIFDKTLVLSTFCKKYDSNNDKIFK